MTRPLPRLTGLADGLAPEERRYDDRTDHRLAPPASGSPASRVQRELSGCGRNRTSAETPAPLVLSTSTAGRSGLSDGLGDEFRHVRRVLTRVDLGRHLTVAVRATLVDRVEHQLLARSQLVEGGTDLRDRIRGLQRVTKPAATPEQRLPVHLLLRQTGDLRGRRVSAVMHARDHPRGHRDTEEQQRRRKQERRETPATARLRMHHPAKATTTSAHRKDDRCQRKADEDQDKKER